MENREEEEQAHRG